MKRRATAMGVLRRRGGHPCGNVAVISGNPAIGRRRFRSGRRSDDALKSVGCIVGKRPNGRRGTMLCRKTDKQLARLRR